MGGRIVHVHTEAGGRVSYQVGASTGAPLLPFLWGCCVAAAVSSCMLACLPQLAGNAALLASSSACSATVRSSAGV